MAWKPWEFLEVSSHRERRVLLASGLGWTLDGMDVTLYSMVIAALIHDLHLSTSHAGLLASLTLVSSAAGGILFGWFADRVGRKTALMASVLVYSLATAACGLARGIPELAAFRVLVGLGMGGEWATGAALVSETWNPEHRGKAIGFMQSGFAAGYALAALMAALVMPWGGWRAVFFAGIIPAVVTLWVRRGVEESPLWLERQRRSQQPSTRDSPAAPRAPNPRRAIAGSVVLPLLINSAALFGWWGIFTWIPPSLSLPVSQGGRGLTLTASWWWIALMQVGMWLGYVSFGYISDALGRKVTYTGYLLLAGFAVAFYARASRPLALLLAGPVVAFFGTGHFTGFGIITSEVFPTSCRATAMGLTYNFGRAISAVAPWVIGTMAIGHRLGSAFWISGVAFLLAGILSLGLPETRGKALV
jgi:MFS family permease